MPGPQGHRYAETVFDDAWLGALPGWPCSPPSEPRELTIVEPGSEADWMRFIWARRSLDQIVDDEVKNGGRFH